MTFLEAVVAISRRPDITLCCNPDEFNGICNSICVYRQLDGDREECIGKLRWPHEDHGRNYAAEVDEYVESALRTDENLTGALTGEDDVLESGAAI